MTEKLLYLNIETSKQLDQANGLNDYPEKVIQIGDGNFIRGFIDWMIFEMNQKSNFGGKIASIQSTPRGKNVPKLNRQDKLFTLILRGIENGKTVNRKHIIDSINKTINPYTNWEDVLKIVEQLEIEFLFSNTTEAGIRYEKEDYSEDVSPLSFPGKVVALLYHRYVHFNGDKDKGLIIIPCELIENNGEELKRICLKIIEDWELSNSFIHWIEEACVFCNTLVDRIVPGYPKEEDQQLFNLLGYYDELLTVAEPYHLFVIEGPSSIETKLPFKQAGLNVYFDKISSYRELKIKFLNGPHTMLATIGLLIGIKTVREGMEDYLLISFINKTLMEEIMTTLPYSEKEKARAYIKQTFDRFANPFLNHRLINISLNSYSKFKTRVWPSIYEYWTKFGENPKRLTFAFASLLYFYKDERKNYEIKDDIHVIHKFHQFYSEFDNSKETLVAFIRNLIHEEFLERVEDLGNLYEAIADDFMRIDREGIKSALLKLEEEGDL
ncbi:tagaturonate reductase [Aquibacillus sp. 3ASR75-11]|uniref:Tagaturonate reductase n=1 Tax=Terrihalobacillus insolitus TaxID=2950438 RepID=A0A9X3WPF5_9BACI|nr:tagaturonate reductase [Terrihalobacillus insolitus]MDC3423410.1 tagaturonate reductase [Terrihalobacillus insolitus]